MSAVANGVDKYYSCTTGGSIWAITNTHPTKAGSVRITINKRPGVSFSSDGIVYDSSAKFDIPSGGSVNIIWNLTLNESITINFWNFNNQEEVVYTIITKNGNMVPNPYQYAIPNPPVSEISYYKIKGFYSLSSLPAPTTAAPTPAPPTAAPSAAPLADPNFTQIVKGVRYYWPNSTISFKNISTKSNYVTNITLTCTAVYKYGGYTDCSVVGLPPPPGFNPDYSMPVRRMIPPGASVSFKMPPVLNPGAGIYIFNNITATLVDGTDYRLTADYPSTDDGYISFKDIEKNNLFATVSKEHDFIFQYQKA
jgi:hypothetical protein